MKTIIIFLFLMLIQVPAFSADLQWNGFASVYGRKTLTDSEVYDRTNSKQHVDFSSNSKVGLNLRSDFAENWSAIGQMVVAQRTIADDFAGTPPQWTPEFDWFFLSYDYSDHWNLKAGRQLLPGMLVAEYVDVGLVYPQRRMPVEFQALALFKYFEGLSVTRTDSIGEFTLATKIFGGDSRPHFEAGNDTALFLSDMIGFSTSLVGDGWLSQITAYRLHSTLVQRKYAGGGAPAQTTEIGPIGSSTESVFVGAKYDKNNIVVYAESGWAALHNENSDDTTVYEFTLGYRVHKWLPYYMNGYGRYKIFADFGTGSFPVQVGRQTSHTVGLNYQIASSVVLKTELLWQKAEDGKVYLSSQGSTRSASIGLDVVF